MTVLISQGGVKPDPHCDRSGCQVNGAPVGTQGFYLYADGCELRFEDERDAERLAVAICQRLGVTLPER